MKQTTNVEKKLRNEQIVRVWMEKPNLTLRELGEMFGITRQRVHQILNKKRTDASQATVD